MTLPLDRSNAEVLRNRKLVFPQDENRLYPRYIKKGEILWYWDVYSGPRKVEFVQVNPDGWVRVWKVVDRVFMANMPCMFFLTRNELIDAKIRRLKQMKCERKDD